MFKKVLLPALFIILANGCETHQATSEQETSHNWNVLENLAPGDLISCKGKTYMVRVSNFPDNIIFSQENGLGSAVMDRATYDTICQGQSKIIERRLWQGTTEIGHFLGLPPMIGKTR